MTEAEKQQEISHAVMYKTIQQVHYYLLNRPGYFYPDQPEQLVDAAVELGFSDGSFFAFGMNFEYVAIDAHTGEFAQKIKAFNKDVPYLKLDVSADAQWAPFIGNTINEAQVTFNWFEDVDEQRHYIPQDLELVCSNGLYLAFCATAYAIDNDGISILGPDSEGEVLVLFSEEDTKYFKRGKYFEPGQDTEVDMGGYID